MTIQGVDVVVGVAVGGPGIGVLVGRTSVGALRELQAVIMAVTDPKTTVSMKTQTQIAFFISSLSVG